MSGEPMTRDPVLIGLELERASDAPLEDGAFARNWSALGSLSTNVLQVGLRLGALNVLQKLEVLELFGARGSGVATMGPLESLDARQLEYVRYLSNMGSNLAVFFAVDERVERRDLESAFDARLVPSEVPPIGPEGTEWVESRLREPRIGSVLAFGHDGEPVCVFVAR